MSRHQGPPLVPDAYIDLSKRPTGSDPRFRHTSGSDTYEVLAPLDGDPLIVTLVQLHPHHIIATERVPYLFGAEIHFTYRHTTGCDDCASAGHPGPRCGDPYRGDAVEVGGQVISRTVTPPTLHPGESVLWTHHLKASAL